MIKYIQQLLPRIREYSSDLDRKELFVDKLFTLLQTNNEVHQYTFNRDGRLILSIDGKTTLGTWELLATRQLLINRGKDIITLDFDFLHPDVLIMKMGGTADNPFIIYDKKIITDGNVLNFLKIFDAEKRDEIIFKLPHSIILESEVDKKLFDENGKPYNGVMTSSPYHYPKYNYKVEEIKIVKSGIVIESYFDVKYFFSRNYGKDELVVIRQKNLYEITIGDRIILEKSFERLKNDTKASILDFDDRNLYFDENYIITEIEVPSNIGRPILFIMILVFFALIIYLWGKN